MSTLKQIFDKLYDNDNKVCTRRSLFEQFNQVAKEWLQQKQPKLKENMTWNDAWRYNQKTIKLLLEELADG